MSVQVVLTSNADRAGNCQGVFERYRVAKTSNAPPRAASISRNLYRFTHETRGSPPLLALEAFKKKTQKTPPATITLAQRRLRDWRARAREK